MFAVIYKWKVKPGHESQFQEAWSQVTKEIRDRWNTSGSRLHKADDDSWIAYAQWPSRERWEEAGKVTPDMTDARKTMRECVDEAEALFRLEIVQDLFL